MRNCRKFTYGAICARTVGTAPHRLIQSRRDEAQFPPPACALPTVAVPLVTGRWPLPSAAFRDAMSHTQGDLRSAVRGAAIGACTALIAFAGVYVAAAATQSGIEEASAPAVRPSTTQAGVDVAQETNASPQAAKATASQRPAQAKQPGLAEAAKPTRDETV